MLIDLFRIIIIAAALCVFNGLPGLIVWSLLTSEPAANSVSIFFFSFSILSLDS